MRSKGFAARLAVALVALGIVGASHSRGARAETLDIPPVVQLTHVWCWLAVGEMVFKHYDIPSVNPAGIYQCGIVGAIAHGTAYHACSVNCSFCTIPAGSSQVLINMIEDYPRKVRQYTGSSNADVKVEWIRSAMSASDVVDEIDEDRPIVAGISPSNPPGGLSLGSQHVALIVGYENDGDTLIVNDPFPFDQVGWDNPYIRAGGRRTIPNQYAIDRDAFESRLNWGESFTTRRVTARRQSYPNYCCTHVGRVGPYPNYSIPEGGACQGFHPAVGIVFGTACY